MMPEEVRKYIEENLSTPRKELPPFNPVPERMELQTVVQEILQPLFESLSKILANNTEALTQIAAAQSVQADRLDALELQMRLQTPMTSKQTSFINDAIRSRSRAILDKHGLADDHKSVTKLSNIIRKNVLQRYGVSGIREIPKHEYSVVLSQVEIFQNALQIKDVIKEARSREKADMEHT